MSTLDSIATTFNRLASGLVGMSRPDRDALAVELAELQANEPEYVDLCAAPPSPAHASLRRSPEGDHLRLVGVTHERNV
jgi:hypothetical protein